MEAMSISRTFQHFSVTLHVWFSGVEERSWSVLRAVSLHAVVWSKVTVLRQGSESALLRQLPHSTQDGRAHQ